MAADKRDACMSSKTSRDAPSNNGSGADERIPTPAPTAAAPTPDPTTPGGSGATGGEAAGGGVDGDAASGGPAAGVTGGALRGRSDVKGGNGPAGAAGGITA